MQLPGAQGKASRPNHSPPGRPEPLRNRSCGARGFQEIVAISGKLQKVSSAAAGCCPHRPNSPKAHPTDERLLGSSNNRCGQEMGSAPGHRRDGERESVVSCWKARNAKLRPVCTSNCELRPRVPLHPLTPTPPCGFKKLRPLVGLEHFFLVLLRTTFLSGGTRSDVIVA